MKWIVLALLLVSCSAVLGDADSSGPFWKIKCAGLPLFRGRVDPIIAPGGVSNHVHRIAGGSNFNVESVGADPVAIFNRMRSSSCTTCNVQNIDLSAYWHPDLFYKWPNGSLSVIPNGGLTMYYQTRAGPTQTNPKYVPFPAGFRMIAGDPFRRSFNASDMRDQSVTFACIPSSGSRPKTNGFPAPGTECGGGLRMQIRFPSCWNGKDLDSKDHASHIVYPLSTSTDGNGDCPVGYTNRTMALFMEAFYSVSDFPLQTTYQQYVLACADNTGYGMHADFLNGWDPVVMQQALNDVSCFGNSTGGDNVRKCKTFAPYVTDPSNAACTLAKTIPLTESFGKVWAIPKLPGCQNITGPQPTDAGYCYGSPQQSYNPPISQRFALISKSTGNYVTALEDNDIPLLANITTANTAAATYTGPSMLESFVQLPWSYGNLTGFSFYPEACYGTCACSTHEGSANAVVCDRSAASVSASSYEAYKFVAKGSYFAIYSYHSNNGLYLAVQPDGTIAPTAGASALTDAALFSVVSLDGGHV